MPKGYRLTNPAHNWTAEQDMKLEEGLERGWSDERIARALGRTANAIRVRRKRLGLPSVLRQPCLYTGRQAAQLLGVDAHLIRRFVTRGWLKATRGPRRGSSTQWCVYEDDLLAFLENPAYWHCWEPQRITETGLRDWALTLPRPQYLTLTEVAKRYHVNVSTVTHWLDRGVLPFVRNGNRMVDERSLEGFVPPYERPRHGQKKRPWQNHELARARRMRAAGHTYRHIADALGRPSPSSVHNALARRR